MNPRLDPATRERLLEAAPDELRQLRRQEPALAPLVDALLAANTEIRDALEGDGPLGDRVPTPPRVDPAAVPSRGRFRPLPLLAAAALGALAVSWAVLRQGTVPETMAPVPTTAAAPAAELAVEAPGNFAVFPTDDPDMAIIWILNGDD